MNDRFRNLMKAHDHIVKGRSKEEGSKKSVRTTLGIYICSI